MEHIDVNSSSIQSQDDFNIKEEIFKYLIHWKWMLVSVFIALLSAFIYLRYSTNIYNSASQIRIIDPSGGVELPSNTASFIYKRSNINLENEIYVLTSYTLLDKVVKQTNYNIKYYNVGRVKVEEISGLPLALRLKDSIELVTATYDVKVLEDGLEIIENDNKTYTFNNYNTTTKSHALPFDLAPYKSINAKNLIGNSYKIKTTSIQSTSRRLKRSLKIEPVGRFSHLLELSIQGENPTRNEQLLNNLMENYKQQGIKDRQQISENTIKFINNRFDYVANELDSVETASKNFKIEQNIPDITSAASNTASLIADVEQSILEVKGQMDYAKNLKSRIQTSTNNNAKGVLPINLLSNIDINSYLNEYNGIIAEINLNIDNGAGVNNPTIVSLNSKLNKLRVSILQSLNLYLDDLKFEQRKLQALKNTYLGKSSEYLNKGQKLRKIERQEGIKEALYILLLQKREEALINKAIAEPSMKIVEYATTKGVVSANKNLVYVMALAIGLALPIGIIFLIHFLDTKIHSKEDITKIITNIPVVGEIPIIKNNNLLFSNPNSTNILAESFRILCSNINYVLPNTDKAKVILSTSTIKGEGKTFMSINLSLAYASLNKKVLLIGSDLRNPQIHSYVNINKNTIGLSNYLHDTDLDWNKIILNAFENYPKHDLILSGDIPPNPSQLLTSERFKQLIEEAQLKYDYIIIDSAPTILVTDTMLISDYADISLFVTRADYTEKKLLDFSKNLYESGKISNLVYAVNGVGSKKAYGYGYNYGYGYGYSNDA